MNPFMICSRSSDQAPHLFLHSLQFVQIGTVRSGAYTAAQSCMLAGQAKAVGFGLLAYLVPAGESALTLPQVATQRRGQALATLDSKRRPGVLQPWNHRPKSNTVQVAPVCPRTPNAPSSSKRGTLPATAERTSADTMQRWPVWGFAAIAAGLTVGLMLVLQQRSVRAVQPEPSQSSASTVPAKAERRRLIVDGHDAADSSSALEPQQTQAAAPKRKIGGYLDPESPAIARLDTPARHVGVFVAPDDDAGAVPTVAKRHVGGYADPSRSEAASGYVTVRQHIGAYVDPLAGKRSDGHTEVVDIGPYMEPDGG